MEVKNISGVSAPIRKPPLPRWARKINNKDWAEYTKQKSSLSRNDSQSRTMENEVTQALLENIKKLEARITKMEASRINPCKLKSKRRKQTRKKRNQSKSNRNKTYP